MRWGIGFLLGLAWVALAAAPALAGSITVLEDAPNAPGSYWGASPTIGSFTDEIGGGTGFRIDRAVVDVSSSSLTVDIYGDYFGTTTLNGAGTVVGDKRGTYGTDWGDLFLSTNGWSPNVANPNGDHYFQDNAATGESWEYVLAVDERTFVPSATPGQYATFGQSSGLSGTASLYAVSNNNILLSDAGPFTGLAYRSGQEVLYDPTGQTALTTGSWWVLYDNVLDENFLRFRVDYSGIGSNGLGLHWGYTCGNDVVEGFAPVPEPGSMVLLGTGVAGLAMARRRRKRAAA